MVALTLAGIVGYGIYQNNNEEMQGLLKELENFESVSDNIDFDDYLNKAERLRHSQLLSQENKEEYDKFKRKYDCFTLVTALYDDMGSAKYKSAYEKINQLLEYDEFTDYEDNLDYASECIGKIILDTWWSVNCKNAIDKAYELYEYADLPIRTKKLSGDTDEVVCGWIDTVDNGYSFGYDIITPTFNVITTPLWYNNLSDFATQLQSYTAIPSLKDSITHILTDLTNRHIDNEKMQKFNDLLAEWNDEDIYDGLESAPAFGVILFKKPENIFSRSSTYTLISPAYVDVDTLTDEENTSYRGIEICSFSDEILTSNN